MRVHLNTAKCQGHLRCMDMAPDIFDCDELGYGVLTFSGSVPEEREQIVLRCAANCPENAISIG